MVKEKPDAKNLNSNLRRLSEITGWFDSREEIDVEEGLKKVKEAVKLIKASKERLKAIENEFEEIKKEIESEEDKSSSSPTELPKEAKVRKRVKSSFDFAAARDGEEEKEEEEGDEYEKN